MKRVVIDTSVIVRHLVDWDKGLIEAMADAGQVQIPMPVWLETVFVLEKVYRVPRETIVEQLAVILADKKVVAEKVLLEQIWAVYATKKSLSVVDCYILVFGKKQGLELVTYDVKLKKAVGRS